MADTAQRAGATADRQGAPTPWSDFDDARWRSRMQQSDIADELFMPLEHGRWTEARFRLVRGEAGQARSRITGVRFLAADPRRENLEPERAVQNDFHRLVASLIKLRAEPDWRRLCLSGETFRTSRPFTRPPRRQFGIVRGHDLRLESDSECARRSHGAIVRAIRATGFAIVDPTTPFDPAAGMVGLLAWVDQLRLRRRPVLWPWLLLLPLLFLLPRCDSGPQFFGAAVETDSFVLVVDRSSSMESHFEALRAEALRLLDQIAAEGGAHADIVSYCGTAASCLGAIRPVDATTRPQLEAFLRGLAPGGGTELARALDIVANEVRAHERPTTLIVLTDAHDGTIPTLLQDRVATRARFGDVEIRSIALTPRLFGPVGPEGAPAVPNDDDERRFAELAEVLGGHFGAVESPR